MTIFLFHGLNGHPQEHWFPWLQMQLEAEGHDVVAPSLPHADHPVREEWLASVHQFQPLIDGRTIFIGHSLGVPFLLSLISSLGHPIAASFLVAGFISPLHNELAPLTDSFVRSLDASQLRSRCPHFEVFHGDDDPYVPLAQARELSDFLRAPLHLIPHGGHLNTAAGYTSFPALLTAINSFAE